MEWVPDASRSTPEAVELLRTRDLRRETRDPTVDRAVGAPLIGRGALNLEHLGELRSGQVRRQVRGSDERSRLTVWRCPSCPS